MQKPPFANPDFAFRRKDPRGLAAEVAYAGALSFLRRKYSKDLEDIDLAVIGVPFDLATTNRSGTRLGPRAIRAASSMIACWSRIYPWDFDTFLRIAAVDWGDISFDFGQPGTAPESIRGAVAEILATNTATLALGGDHFITYPILQAYAEKHGKPLSLIHFDAHSDTWRDPDGRIDHGTMFFHAARKGIVAPERSVQIGLRTYNPETHGFNIFDAGAVRSMGTKTVAERAREIVGDNPCYITFDIDCLDPAYAPGTGTPEPGGLTTTEARELLFGLRGVHVAGMDVVEVSPPYDHGEITALAGANIAFMLASLFAERFPRHPREDARAAKLSEAAADGGDPFTESGEDT
ncbi:MAG: agmatinase [Alphaproteobacteria bacterium]|nr:agmatinase [Alphaproteobacteria bacterium]